MSQSLDDPTEFAVCIDNGDYPTSLELHKVYRVLADVEAERDGDLRVVDESGEDYLYPATSFLRIRLSHDAEEALNASLAHHLVKSA
jgi:hypothetical protein